MYSTNLRFISVVGEYLTHKFLSKYSPYLYVKILKHKAQIIPVELITSLLTRKKRTQYVNERQSSNVYYGRRTSSTFIDGSLPEIFCFIDTAESRRSSMSRAARSQRTVSFVRIQSSHLLDVNGLTLCTIVFLFRHQKLSNSETISLFMLCCLRKSSC